MKTTTDITNQDRLGKVISLADYKAKKDSVKAVFKDSLNNDSIMKRYNINQPTLEERQERIKQSIQRINGLLKELNNQ